MGKGCFAAPPGAAKRSNVGSERGRERGGDVEVKGWNMGLFIHMHERKLGQCWRGDDSGAAHGAAEKQDLWH